MRTSMRSTSRGDRYGLELSVVELPNLTTMTARARHVGLQWLSSSPSAADNTLARQCFSTCNPKKAIRSMSLWVTPYSGWGKTDFLMDDIFDGSSQNRVPRCLRNGKGDINPDYVTISRTSRKLLTPQHAPEIND
ncbi:hypothetical protein CISG_04301 [Coccidioides immitis RMSCC 3703]|uniref:Uncharacterized protein n=2 Tax=Coccidioides immitis TaxID=5501 RepID=A0A0J8QQ06_COCIT|nr:hypothetical protein CIRG_02354 [Coccidioides immitis RMSCC 2394]KMU74594.1 hypothetical protein CISG_04301 [Coccidioides immitis RMSCC 3703]